MLMKTTGKAGKPGDKEYNGRWTREEHELFLKALNEYGREWKKVAKLIKSRTSAQIRSHAQKYFQKLSKEKKAGLHGGAEQIHGKHVVLQDVGNPNKRQKKGKDSDSDNARRPPIKKIKRPVTPPANVGNGGRFSPMDKPRASPNPQLFEQVKAYLPTGSVSLALAKTLETKLGKLLEERLNIAGTNDKCHDSKLPMGDVPTPRLSPLNATEANRVKHRLERRDLLVRCDRKIQNLLTTESYHVPCVCERPYLLAYCQRTLANASAGRKKWICLTLRQQLYGNVNAVLKKCAQLSTPQSEKFIGKWREVNKEVDIALLNKVEAVKTPLDMSYQSAESLYLTLSPDARENLSYLDNEELMAVQVLIGSKVGQFSLPPSQCPTAPSSLSPVRKLAIGEHKGARRKEVTDESDSTEEDGSECDVDSDEEDEWSDEE